MFLLGDGKVRKALAEVDELIAKHDALITDRTAGLNQCHTTAALEEDQPKVIGAEMFRACGVIPVEQIPSWINVGVAVRLAWEARICGKRGARERSSA